MEESKKVFVGSLHEFGREARATVIDEYREQLSAGAAKPFISYDERTHLFSFTCDRTDSAAVSNFFSSVYAYVDVFEKTTKKELFHSPLLKPMPGTFVQDALVLEDNGQQGEDLLEVAEDSDSELDGHAPTHNNCYWAPVEGSSKMLTRDIARAITDLTEADLFPEHDRNRVVIMGGDAAAALKKLTNLEPLMDLLAQQSKEGANRPSGNVLMLTMLDDLSTLGVKVVSKCPLATERIVVDLQGRPNILNKSLTHVLRRNERHGPWLMPCKLTEETVRGSATITEGFSQIWSSQPYSTFGDPKSAKPIPDTPTANMPFVPAPQKFVTASQAHDIDAWTKNIAEGVDPESIDFEAPFETAPTPGRQRLVREETDDEDEGPEEEELETPPPPTTKRVPVLNSDNEAEEIVLLAPAAQRNAEEQVGDRSAGSAPDSDVERGLSSNVSDPHEPHKMPQPTWTTDPFSIFTEEEELQGAPSERQSTILAMPSTPSPGLSLFSSHQPLQESSTQSFHQSPHHSPHQSLDLLSAQLSRTPTYEVRGSSETPMSPPKFTSRDEFDPNRLGRVRQNGYSARFIGSPSSPIAPAARGRGRGHPDSVRGASGFRGRGTSGNQSNYSHFDLIELSGPPLGISTGNLQPPPGLDIRGNNLLSTSCSAGINLLDGPIENIQLPSMRPVSLSPEHYQEPFSASIKKLMNVSSPNNSASYVNRYNPPLDLAKIENDQLAKLFKFREEAKEKKRLDEEEAEKLTAESQVPSQWTASRNTTQRKQKDDERTSRRVHSTMSQQAPNPGKRGKQGAHKLTEKERKQRLQDVLGEVKPKMMPSTTTSTETMSTRKKQALKKNIDSAAAAYLAVNQFSSKQTSNLIQYLKPLFAASRGFPGQLKFEIQLGQVLIANAKTLLSDHAQLFSIKNWESVFCPSKQQPIATTFTNILTRNGHDIDRLLKIDAPCEMDSCGAEKLFDELNPGPSEISYEFHCQSKQSVEFWIVVDRTGNYIIRKGTSTIGTVNLHYPASIWDARAILHGTAKFCEPEEETAMIVASFIESVYVPAQDSVSITYRQPAENDMTVCSVTVKRTSLHNCHVTERQDIQLQVIEVKELFYRFHQKDRKLTQAFEKSHQDSRDHDRIHYEVSLVSNSINEMLKQNRTLETGDLANGVSGEQLLKPKAVQNMIDLVSRVVSQIDWAGVKNNGTLLRIMQEAHDRSARIATTIPGTRPTPSFAGMTSTAAGGTALRPDIHGIRINTKAERGCDADGKPVLIGMGGAMIPIPVVEDELNFPSSDLMPDDSASNIGIPNARPYVPSAAFARGFAARGPNFW